MNEPTDIYNWHLELETADGPVVLQCSESLEGKAWIVYDNGGIAKQDAGIDIPEGMLES